MPLRLSPVFSLMFKILLVSFYPFIIAYNANTLFSVLQATILMYHEHFSNYTFPNNRIFWLLWEVWLSF